MHLDSIFLVVALGAIVAGFVQGLSGFAFSLVAMSFWAWVVDPQLAVTMTVFGALTGQVLAAVTVRRSFDLKLLLPFLLGGLAGIPLGLMLLPHLDIHIFKMILGLFLVIWCSMMLTSNWLPRIKRGGYLADGLIGSIGGMMGSLGGFSGTIPTLWCTLRGFDKDTQRTIIQNFNLAVLLVTMITYISTGIVTREMLPMFAIIAPAMLIPTLLGARLYAGIPETTFRKIILSLLMVSAIAMLASSF